MAVAIALADDGVIVREGVARVLAAQPGIEVVQRTGTDSSRGSPGVLPSRRSEHSW